MGKVKWATGMLAGLLCGACSWIAGESGEVYPLSPTEVASMLSRTDTPTSLQQQFADAEKMRVITTRRGDSQVVWRFRLEGEALANLTANLKPEGEGTRVNVNFAMADGKMAKAMIADLADGREFLEGALTAGLVEHVDATLERRKFDERMFTKRVAMLALANPAAARRFMTQFEKLNTDGTGSATAREVERIKAQDDYYRVESRRNQDGGYDPMPMDDA